MFVFYTCRYVAMTYVEFIDCSYSSEPSGTFAAFFSDFLLLTHLHLLTSQAKRSMSDNLNHIQMSAQLRNLKKLCDRAGVKFFCVFL